MDQDEKEFLSGLFSGANLEHAQIVVIAKDHAKVVYKDNDVPKKPSQSAYTDDVVTKALQAIVGEDKPLNEKQLYIGVANVLKYKCGWAGKLMSQCEKINKLPVAKKLEIKCDYNNVKVPGALKFASLEYTKWKEYEPNNNEREVFLKSRAVAYAFDEELDRQLMQ